MQNKLFKRIASLAVCLAVLLAGMPMAFNVGASATVITDDFEDATINWTKVGESAPSADTIVTVTESGSENKVFLPTTTKSNALGSANIFTYNSTWPDRKITEVTGKFKWSTAYGLVIVYYYKDADNWRGLSFVGTTGAQTIRFCGKENGTANNFAYYGNYISGTLTSILDVETTFKITYNTDGTASMLLSNSTGVSDKIDLLTVAKSFAGNVFSNSIKANEGQFAMANCMATDGTKDYFDDITVRFIMTAEEEAEAGAEEFRNRHQDILSKTIENITSSDESAINAALADYDLLVDGAKALLTAEYQLLDSFLATAITSRFNVETFIDDFSGDLYWKQVGNATSTTSPITNEAFLPSESTDADNGQVSLYVHRAWPTERKLKTVIGKYTLANQYTPGSMIVYYYKDPNNWRGFYIQRAGAFNLMYVMKESDPTDSSKVYFKKATSFNYQPQWENNNIPAGGTVVDFKLTYDEGGRIYVEFTQDTLTSASVKLSDAFTSKVADTMVSVDGGATFTASDETHTFAAISDSKTSQFGMGRGLNNSTFDDITATFEKTPAEHAQAFRAKYTDVLNKDVNDFTDSDRTALLTALRELNKLNTEVKAYLNDDRNVLINKAETLFSNTMSGSSYTEDFEGDYLWQEAGSAPDDFAVVENGTNHVFKPAASSITSQDVPSVYYHSFWPNKTLTSITGKMYIGHELSSSDPSNVIIYSYQDENNWRGLTFFQATNSDNTLSSQSIHFTGMEDGNVLKFPYYDHYNRGTLTTLVNKETTFTITYNEDGTASMVLENDTGVSNTIPLLVNAKGFETCAYLKYINANYCAFALGSVSNVASQNDWFDDITFNFGDSFSDKANEFKTTYADVLALETADVTTADKVAIEAAYDAYNKISRSAYMATLLDNEGLKVNALFDALIKAHKVDDDIIRIACVGDSITEGFGVNSISYPVQLQNILDDVYGEGVFLVGNFGVSGATAYSYFDTKLYKESLYFNPNIVLTMLGTNDIQNSGLVFEYYYKKLADVYQSLDSVSYYVAASSIITNGAPHDQAQLPARRAAVKDMAIENNWYFLDMFDATDELLLADTETNYKDKLHPTEIGYNILAQAAFNFFKNGDYGMDGQPVIFSELNILLPTEEFTNAYNAIDENSTVADIIKALTAYNSMYKTSSEHYAYSQEYAIKHEELVDRLVVANVLTRPEMYSATIKVATDEDQDLRFKTKVNDDSVVGYNVVEYGTIMIPNQFITKSSNANYNNEQLMLGMKVSRGDAGTASVAVAKETSIPITGIFYATLKGSSLDVNCGVRIAARSYVKYSNGSETFVVYSSNTSNDYSADKVTVGVSNGIAVRSVYSIARRMAVEVAKNGSAYGTIVGTESIPADVADSDLETQTTVYTGSNCLEFVLKNEKLLRAIVNATQTS